MNTVYVLIVWLYVHVPIYIYPNLNTTVFLAGDIVPGPSQYELGTFMGKAPAYTLSGRNPLGKGTSFSLCSTSIVHSRHYLIILRIQYPQTIKV